jgi:hypothetical protein
VAAAPQAPPYGPKATRLNTPLPWTQPVLVILRCPAGARLCDRRDPTRGHLAAPVVPTISRDLLAKVAGSKAALAWPTLVRTIFDQPDATEVTA